jgi:hypothetical protein
MIHIAFNVDIVSFFGEFSHCGSQKQISYWSPELGRILLANLLYYLTHSSCTRRPVHLPDKIETRGTSQLGLAIYILKMP